MGADKILLFDTLERKIDNRGKTPPLSESGYPLIEVKHIKEDQLYPVIEDTTFVDQDTWDSWFRDHLKHEDILFSTVGSIARSCIVPENPAFCIAQNVLGFRVNRHIAVPRFVYYAIRSTLFQNDVQGRTIETVQKSIKVQDLEKCFIPYFPLPEQSAIAHILGTLDDKIELNRQMNQPLEAMAKALFKSWFVDFEPFNDDGMQDSLLGPIPKGWNIDKLSKLCSTQYGYTASAIDEPVGPHLLRVTDINKQNWIEWTSVPYCQIEEQDKPKYMLNVGDILVARMADPGKSAIIEQPIDAVFASYLVRLKTESLAYAYYVYGFLKSRAYAEYADGAMGGSSVQKTMNAKVIVDTNLVIPPKQTLESFWDYILPLRKRLVANVEQSASLATIRDTLMPKLLSGEIRVKDVEKFMEEKI